MKSEGRREIMFGGFGGQGIVTAGYITGQAAVVYDSKEATFTQVYGPEARGSACSSGVVISQDEIIGQGLRKADTSSGWEEARGNSYVMKKVDFSDTFQPRLTATWNYSPTASAFASFYKLDLIKAHSVHQS